MKLREGIAWTLTLAALAAGGVLWIQGREMSGRLAAVQAEAAARAAKGKALEARAATAERDLESFRTDAAALRKGLEQEQAARKATETQGAEMADKLRSLEASAKPAAQPKPAKKKGGLKAMMTMSARAFQDPAMRKQMRQGLGMQVGMMYEDLLQEWGLEGEARKAVVDLLADRMMTQGESAMLMMDDEVAPEEVVRRQDEALAQSQSALAAQLDAARLERLEAYDKEMPDRMLGQQVDQRLAGLGLDEAQHARVRAVLMEESRGVQASVRVGGMNGGMASSGHRLTVEEVQKSREMMSVDAAPLGDALKTMKESNARTLEKVRPLMSQEQLETFRKQQDAQIQMMEMASKMMSGGGEEDDGGKD